MKTYQEEIMIRTRDCDVNGQWRPSAVLEEMQEIAGTHCALLGCGRDVLLEKGIVWILARSEVQMERYPAIGEKITVQTFNKPVRLRFFPRYYTFTDAQGRMIGKAGTLWLLMDIHTRQTIPAGEIAALLPDNSDLAAPMALPATVGQLQGDETVMEYTPVYTDLDVNGHVNNTRYADWLCNALGVEAMRRCSLQSLILNFNAEVRPGQQVTLHLTRRGEEYRLAGYHGEKLAFEVGGRLQERALPEKEG